VLIHDAALHPGELPGLARYKSLGGALAQAESRTVSELISAVFRLATRETALSLPGRPASRIAPAARG
jgi:death on curing protein